MVDQPLSYVRYLSKEIRGLKFDRRLYFAFIGQDSVVFHIKFRLLDEE